MYWLKKLLPAFERSSIHTHTHREKEGIDRFKESERGGDRETATARQAERELVS